MTQQPSNPSSLARHQLLAQAETALTSGDSSPVITQLKGLLDVEPGDVEALSACGLLMLRVGDTQAAQEYLVKAWLFAQDAPPVQRLAQALNATVQQARG